MYCHYVSEQCDPATSATCSKFFTCMCVCVCVCAYVRACERASVRAFVRAFIPIYLNEKYDIVKVLLLLLQQLNSPN